MFGLIRCVQSNLYLQCEYLLLFLHRGLPSRFPMWTGILLIFTGSSRFVLMVEGCGNGVPMCGDGVVMLCACVCSWWDLVMAGCLGVVG